MLRETQASERAVLEDQALMGDALRELRTAHGVPRNAMADALGITVTAVGMLEDRCTTVQARRYRAAVLKLAQP